MSVFPALFVGERFGQCSVYLSSIHLLCPPAVGAGLGGPLVIGVLDHQVEPGVVK
jgi:hypothetical protein